MLLKLKYVWGDWCYCEAVVDDPEEGVVGGEGGEVGRWRGRMGRGKGVEGCPKEVYRQVCNRINGGVRRRGPKFAPSEVHGMDGGEADESPYLAGYRVTAGRGGLGSLGRGGGSKSQSDARESGDMEEGKEAWMVVRMASATGQSQNECALGERARIGGGVEHLQVHPWLGP